MRLIPFEPAHLDAFPPQAAQAAYAKMRTREQAEAVAPWFSLTGIDDEGNILGCAGLAQLENGDLGAWAVFSERVLAMPLALFRVVKRGLDAHADRRMIAYVAQEHDKAARFAEALHFNLCGTERLEDGGSVLCYVRDAR